MFYTDIYRHSHTTMKRSFDMHYMHATAFKVQTQATNNYDFGVYPSANRKTI